MKGKPGTENRAAEKPSLPSQVFLNKLVHVRTEICQDISNMI